MVFIQVVKLNLIQYYLILIIEQLVIIDQGPAPVIQPISFSNMSQCI